jgi:hypothetical protein
MNRLPNSKRIQMLVMLSEGVSLRETSRATRVSINTVISLLADAGRACLQFHDERARGLFHLGGEIREVWSFNYCKISNGLERLGNYGDVWTWASFEADSRLIVNWVIGERDSAWAREPDGHRTCSEEFPYRDDVDGGQSAALYCPAEADAQCRLPRVVGYRALTPMQSKKLGNHRHAISLYFTLYNWTRIDSKLQATPAMAAGLTDRAWSLDEVAMLRDETGAGEADANRKK